MSDQALLPLLRVSGSHREVGHQIGEACAAAVRAAVDFTDAHPRDGRTMAEQLALAEEYRDVTRRSLPYLVDELDAVAEAASVDPVHVFAASIEEIWTTEDETDTVRRGPRCRAGPVQRPGSGPSGDCNGRRPHRSHQRPRCRGRAAPHCDRLECRWRAADVHRRRRTLDQCWLELCGLGARAATSWRPTTTAWASRGCCWSEKSFVTPPFLTRQRRPCGRIGRPPTTPSSLISAARSSTSRARRPTPLPQLWTPQAPWCTPTTTCARRCSATRMTLNTPSGPTSVSNAARNCCTRLHGRPAR